MPCNLYHATVRISETFIAIAVVSGFEVIRDTWEPPSASST